MNARQARQVLDIAAKARIESALADKTKLAKCADMDEPRLDFIAHIISIPKGCLGKKSAPRERLKLRDIASD